MMSMANDVCRIARHHLLYYGAEEIQPLLRHKCQRLLLLSWAGLWLSRSTPSRIAFASRCILRWSAGLLVYLAVPLPPLLPPPAAAIACVGMLAGRFATDRLVAFSQRIRFLRSVDDSALETSDVVAPPLPANRRTPSAGTPICPTKRQPANQPGRVYSVCTSTLPSS